MNCCGQDSSCPGDRFSSCELGHQWRNNRILDSDKSHDENTAAYLLYEERGQRLGQEVFDGVVRDTSTEIRKLSRS